ncbi:MAG: hypothetical protein J6Z11_13820 [Candidatus Riflebacteria bacterium]|nr:hypothetical protein [Candidatus Riflebacteria bacterium]
MSIAVFKQTLWSKKIQNQLDTLTGLRKHSDYSFQGEIKGGNVLKITASVRPTVNTYVPGTDISYENVKGTSQDLPINIYKYATQTFDDVDEAQSIPGVMENATREMAKALADQANIEVANKMLDACKNGVAYTDNDDQEATETVPQESSASAVTKENAIPRVETGLVALYENNVNPAEDLWGEFSPKYFSFIRQSLTETLTNNVELAKTGAVGKYNNVKVCIENLLPKDGNTRYNFIRTNKAVAYVEAIEKTEAGRLEKQFKDYVRSLMVIGTKVVRAKEMYAIKELVSSATI